MYSFYLIAMRLRVHNMMIERLIRSQLHKKEPGVEVRFKNAKAIRLLYSIIRNHAVSSDCVLIGIPQCTHCNYRMSSKNRKQTSAYKRYTVT